jgi:hypothetical protein
MLEHKLLFSLVVLASFANLGWVLIIYILSFHTARRLIDGIDVGYVPRRRELQLIQFPALCHSYLRMR